MDQAAEPDVMTASVTTSRRAIHYAVLPATDPIAASDRILVKKGDSSLISTGFSRCLACCLSGLRSRFAGFGWSRATVGPCSGWFPVGPGVVEFEDHEADERLSSPPFAPDLF
jgi:hypothetical protein